MTFVVGLAIVILIDQSASPYMPAGHIQDLFHSLVLGFFVSALLLASGSKKRG